MRTSAPFVLFLVLSLTPLGRGAGAAEPDPIPLSQSLGPEIDRSERDAYRLFPDARGFETARFYARGSGYRIEYSDSAGRTRTRSISADALEETRWHVAFADAYREEMQSGAGPLAEPVLLRMLSLRYASRGRYETAYLLSEDLRSGFPDTEPGRWAAEVAPRMERLARHRRALIWPGTLMDRSGRTDLLVFSGYYGLWLGIAVPVALHADEAQAFAAGLLLAPTASVLIASQATREAGISDAQATLVSLGGHLGTWQGIGWAANGEADGNEVVGWGVGTGLAGVALAIPFGHAVGFTAGGASATSSAMYWGGWFGAVVGVLANHDETQDHGVLRDMLIGSDAAVLGTGIAARRARLTESRMRLINLAGIVGTAFGGGLVLLTEVDSEETAFGIVGAGGLAGLLVGVHLTRTHDAGVDFADAPAGASGPALHLTMRRVRGTPVPSLGVRLGF